MSDTIAFTTLVDVDPRPSNTSNNCPNGEVSFIAMSDVSETGEWVRKQTRRRSQLGTGYTPFEEGDILFAKITPCMENGKGAFASGLVGGTGFGSTEFFVLRPKPGVAPRFVFHWSQNPNFRKLAETFMIGSAGQQRVQPNFFARAHIPLVPREQQQCIAEVLDTVDQALHSTEQLVAKLKLMKQGLLHDLLTRGIDDNGELRDSNRHPERFKDSPLGRIPTAWTVAGLLDIGSTERQPILTGPFGAQLSAADFTKDGIPVLRIGNVQWGSLDLDDLIYVRTRKANELARFLIQEGDLLFARQGATTGRNALADRRVNGALINYHIIRVAPDLARCHPTFLYSVFNSHLIQSQVDREKGRSTREGVSAGTLSSLQFPLPSIDEQHRFAELVEAVDDQLALEDSRLAKVRLLKQALMDDLLTGRVRVTPLLEGST